MFSLKKAGGHVRCNNRIWIKKRLVLNLGESGKPKELEGLNLLDGGGMIRKLGGQTYVWNTMKKQHLSSFNNHKNGH